MLVDEPPLRRYLETGRIAARAAQVIVSDHRKSCPCVQDRKRLAYALGASPECDCLPDPILLDLRPRLPHLVLEDLEQLQGHAAVLLRQASIPRPPVRENLVALLDPERVVYVRKEKLDRRADHQLVANSWVIRVNQSLIPPAQKFALMTEGFHVLREAGRLELASRGDPALDWLARQFAGMVLMPERWVRDVWIARNRHVAQTAVSFGVSTSAMRIRLRELGLLRCDTEN